ncbi:hypothetical protein DI272_09505 [Streptomyces sp. Act143]|uniref:hypothetical protein n=1 Tax=Streptomyces sp. Act143 TaxID=2200760 RepID=UPI000D67ACE8|nr:hypothetical protein [Streptomyces sp. Act143]PWI14372.1 hypothetical protein DI272_09505 [Streptomyces sp. Act143]
MAPERPTVLITVTLPPGAALADARRRLGLADDEVDTAYGLVPVDPAHGTYALLVTEEAAARLPGAPEAKGAYQGPFANPKIEPFGPVQPKEEETGGGEGEG